MTVSHWSSRNYLLRLHHLKHQCQILLRLKAGVDMRVPLSENLLVIGGTASLLGFRHRLLAELNHLAKNHPKYSKLISKKSFKVKLMDEIFCILTGLEISNCPSA